MKELLTALATAYAKCGYVQKKGRMEGVAKYSYAKETDFIEAVRPVFLEHGLTISPCGVSQLHHDQYHSAKGTIFNRIVGVFTFRLGHSASGETMEVTALGEGVDSGDKASYKAMTGALKYALRQTLLIETGDDPDDEQPEPRAEPVNQLTEKQQAFVNWVDEAIKALTDATPEAIHSWLSEEKNAEKLKYAKDNWASQYERFKAIGVELS